MAKLKFKSNGKWESIAAFQGEPGKDGAIQYTAGEGITIENNTISAEVTKDYIDGKLEELADMGFTPIIVESLPTENIQTNTIYMIPSQDGEGENVYEEWMYINNTWEKVGSTGVGSGSVIKEYVWDLNATNYMNSDNITLTNAQKTSLISVLNQIITDGNASYYNLIVMNSNSTAVNTVGNKYHIISDNHSSKSYKLAFLGTNASNKTLELSGISFKSYTGKELPYVHKMAMKLTGVYTNTNGLITSITTGTITAANGAIAVYGSDWSERTPQSNNDPITLGYLSNNTLRKTNTTEYTPTDDYNPATKKYVDDAVANIEIPASGGDEKINHYYMSVTSSISDFNTNYSIDLSSRQEELITLCESVYQDVVNGITPLLHLRFDYGTDFYSKRRCYITMELDGQNPGMIDAVNSPFQFKRLSKFENAFNDKLILHTLHVAYNSSSGKITSASFSCKVSEYSTKKYVDDAIAALRAELGGE